MICQQPIAVARGGGVKLECVRGEGFVWLARSIAVFRCRVEANYPGSDHCIILGRVIDMLGPEECDRPLVYHRRRHIHLGQETGGGVLLESKQP